VGRPRTGGQVEGDVVGGVLQGEQVAAVLPPVERGRGGERLKRAVSRAGAVPAGITGGDWES
jgi:hypothetical protein